LLLDLQPALANAPVSNPEGILGRLDESEFRAFADRVNFLLEETIKTGLFAQERELICSVVHRFNSAAELLSEIKTWTGTAVPPPLVERMKQSNPPFDVDEGATLHRLRRL
jgi:hypothetical protein